jgi:hypothetical protein
MVRFFADALGTGIKWTSNGVRIFPFYALIFVLYVQFVIKEKREKGIRQINKRKTHEIPKLRDFLSVTISSTASPKFFGSPACVYSVLAVLKDLRIPAEFHARL